MKLILRYVLLFTFLFTNNSCEFLFHRIHNPKPIAKEKDIIENSYSSKESGELRFIAIGDWGEKGKFSQKEVALAMQKIELEEKIDFILTAGDNFYPNGVKDISDQHFKESFEDMYKFSKPIPWYITLGNHDYMGDIQALVDYGNKNSSWILPHTYYSFERKISEKENVLFVVTDTNEFVDILGFLSYRSYMRNEKGKKQLNWMEEQLKTSKAKWKIVVGHHPIYSAGAHGDTKVLQKEFLEILEKNKVDLYLAGHEHDLQYLKHPDKKIHFFISGGGSKIREMKSSPYTVFAASQAGFAVLTITEKSINLRFINESGKQIYETTIE